MHTNLHKGWGVVVRNFFTLAENMKRCAKYLNFLKLKFWKIKEINSLVIYFKKIPKCREYLDLCKYYNILFFNA